MHHPFKEERVFSADSNDVERFIDAKFPNMPTYEIPPMEEQKNDTTMRISVGGYDWTFSEYDQKQLQACLDKGDWDHYMLGTILNYLHTVEVLKSGTYLINLSW